jgi:replicative DNA helicase
MKEVARQQLELYLAECGHLSRGNVKEPFRCLNPSHEDRNPSMSFDPMRYKVHCFGCGVDWDIFDVVGAEYGLNDAKEKFEKTYALLGLNAASYSRRDSTSLGGAPRGYIYKEPAVNVEVSAGKDYTEYYKACQARVGETDYLQSRGISRETEARFQIGYDAEWSSPSAIAEGKNPPKSPRLIIPTSKSSYIARATSECSTEEQKMHAKMKEGKVEIFNYGCLATAKKPVFIVEGEIDALSIVEVGGEAIALGSTAYVGRLLTRLGQDRTEVSYILALDNDDAGKKATARLVEGLSKLEIPCCEFNISGEHKDPNEALTSNMEAFVAAVREAETVLAQEKELEKEKYLQTSAAAHLLDFVDGIAANVNTPFIPSGFSRLDGIFAGGLYEGLHIVGSISSLGKTSLVLQMGDQIAQKGSDVLIFSLEMSRTELMAKSISRHTLLEVLGVKCDMSNAKTSRGITTGIRYKDYSVQEKELISSSIRVYEKYAMHIFISEGIGNIGVEQIREAVEKHIRITGRTPVVVIDYLQILAPYNERVSDKQNIDKSVMELKRISRDCKLPIVCISSLNRQNYRLPVSMEAFKESGAIEYSSDVLIGLQLAGTGSENFDVDKAKSENPRKIELLILKNRNGVTGDKIRYKYYPLFNYFEEDWTQYPVQSSSNET